MEAKNLRSERLLLRGYQPEDISAWQKWDTDPEVQKYLPGPANEPQSDADKLKYLNDCLAETDAIYWSLVLLETKETIGTTSLNDIDLTKGTAELSIIIGIKEWWGRGLATEALKAVINYAKEDLKLRQLTAGFQSGNLAMAEVLKNLGFVKTDSHHQSRIVMMLNL